MTDQEHLQYLKAPWENKSGLLIDIGRQSVLRQIMLEKPNHLWANSDFENLNQVEAKIESLIREFREKYD